MTGPRIVATGSVIVDMTLQVPALPPLGGDVIASPPSYDVGGGFNLIYAAARQGAEVAYAGGHGTGALGDRVRAALQELGVTVLRAAADSGDTGLCLTFVDARAERTFVTAPGAEAVLAPGQLDAIDVAPSDIVALSGYDLVYAGAGDALAAWAGSLPTGQPLLLDPGPLVAEIPTVRWAAVIARLTVLTVNEREAELLAGEPVADIGELHRRIRQQHPLDPAALVVIRHGAGGCTYDGGPGGYPVTTVESIPVVAVDTTGAGDTHTGVLLAELLAGTGTREAVHRANLAAAISVTRSGPASAPTRAEVDAAVASR
jgi:ribokinase